MAEGESQPLMRELDCEELVGVNRKGDNGVGFTRIGY